MVELITKIDEMTGKPIIEEQSALSGFRYENGYMFSATDLGNKGVKVELVHKQDDGGAIILPPRKAEECGRWLLQTLGQRHHNLPEELLDVLDRLAKRKGLHRILKWGDKKKIKNSLKLLRSQQLKE